MVPHKNVKYVQARSWEAKLLLRQAEEAPSVFVQDEAHGARHLPRSSAREEHVPGDVRVPYENTSAI